MTTHPISRRSALAGAAAMLLFDPLKAQASTYPSKVITTICGYAAGGSGDFLSRTMSNRMQKTLGQSIVVDNVTGVGGALALQKALAAPADGYTISFATNSELILTPLTIAAAKYKAEDFRMIGLVADNYMMLIARPDLPANTVAELVALAKSRADRPLTVGHLGRGGIFHLPAERFMRDTGIKLVDVPYRGIAPMLPDLVSGQVDIAFIALGGPTLGMIQKGLLKAIAYTSVERQAALPSLPTFDESGLVKDFVFTAWGAIMLPKNTPEPVAQRLNAAVAEAIADPGVRKAISDSGQSASKPMTLAEANQFYVSETSRYRALAKLINLKSE